MSPEEKIRELSLVLPEPIKVPPDVNLPFSWVRVRGDRAYISGHIALNANGSIYEIVGKVGAEVSV
ncbi:MAG: RidA family protein, partial [Planctomycetota bacterium]